MIRRLIKVFFLVLPMVFLTIGCADDLRNLNFGVAGEEVAISFTVDKVSLTRDGSYLEWESAIDHAYLLFYDSSNEEDGDLPVTFVRAEIKEDSPGALTFKMPLILEENKGYRLVAVANAEDYVPDGFSSFGSYLSAWCGNESDVRDRSFHIFKEDVLTSALDFLPMVGSPEQGGKFSFTKENGAYQVSTSLKFRRSVSRVDLVNLIKDGFSVEGVALCNWRDSFGIESSEYPVGTIHNEISEFLSAIVSDESGIQKMMGQLYCFPSVSENAAINDTISTALIIKAKYGDDADPSYYRINVGMSGSRAEVKANTKYSVTIQSVKGRGAATPEEAYASDENLLVLSMVDDWDFEENFTMDDYGNFIILSRRSVEFAADSQEIVEIKVLSSTGLNWNVEYIADGEDSTDAFSVSKVSDRSIYVSPAGSNSGSVTLSGKCRVSAITSHGNTLTVDVILHQHPLGDAPYTPDIPWDKDYALVPLQGDGVKVDHEKMTIEIDGFDPNCFNSFIDIPFLVYINKKLGENEEVVVNVDTENALQWPLEGRVAKQPAEDFYYCRESFTDGSVYNSANANKVSRSELDVHDLVFADGDKCFISVGAMAPDDPMITRTISVKLAGGGAVMTDWTYTVKIKPRSVIIDDVIITGEGGESFVVMDRNLQLATGSTGNPEVCGRDASGKRAQAYHYCDWDGMKIPFKFENASSINNNLKGESFHTPFKGYSRDLNEYFIYNGAKDEWLKTFVFKNGMNKNSPFYDNESVKSWEFPQEQYLELVRTKMRLSKMRMFLVSDVPAIDGVETLPICCYFPYMGSDLGKSDKETAGYYGTGNPVKNYSSTIFLAESTKVNSVIKTETNQKIVARLVRPLTSDELESYKTEYLGYGDKALTLSPCHADTYPWVTFTPVK